MADHISTSKRLLLIGILSIAPVTAWSQLNSSTASVTLTATLGETLTVSATPSAITFALVAGGTAAGSAPISIGTAWVLSGSRANVVVDAYFATSAAALSGTSANIPSSEVCGTAPTGTPTTPTAFTQTTALGPAGGGLAIFTQALTAANRSSSRTDNLSLQINLASQPQLPAGSYTGTLTIQAQAL